MGTQSLGAVAVQSKAVQQDLQDFRMIPLRLLQASRSNPRQSFDGPEQQDLVASIREKGIIEPLIIRALAPSVSAPVGSFEVVVGGRRLRAAQDLKLETVPCIVRQLDDSETLEFQIIENLQRKDVSPLEEANGYKNLLEGWHAPGSKDPRKCTVEEIARKVGKSKEYVYARLKLTELAAPAKEAIAEGKITPGHAILLSRLQPKDQASALKASQGNKFDGPMSVRQLDQYIDDRYRLDLAKAPWGQADASLVPAAGACSTCPKQAKGRCEDRVCYAGKMDAHIQQKRKALPGAPLVVAGWTADADLKFLRGRYNLSTVLAYDEYRLAEGKKCPDAQLGIVVHGEGAGKPIKICTKKSCKVHRDPYASSSYSRPAATKSKAALAAEARAKEKAALDHKVEEAALKQLAGVTFELGKEELIRIADSADGWINNYRISESLPRPKVDWAKLKPAALVNWIGLRLAASCVGEYAPKNDRAYFEAVCKRHKIDLGKLRKELQAAVAKPEKGVCRICGCTEEDACDIGGQEACSWADKSETLCSNPVCVKKAKKGKAVEATQKT